MEVNLSAIVKEYLLVKKRDETQMESQFALGVMISEVESNLKGLAIYMTQKGCDNDSKVERYGLFDSVQWISIGSQGSYVLDSFPALVGPFKKMLVKALFPDSIEQNQLSPLLFFQDPVSKRTYNYNLVGNIPNPSNEVLSTIFNSRKADAPTPPTFTPDRYFSETDNKYVPTVDNIAPIYPAYKFKLLDHSIVPLRASRSLRNQEVSELRPLSIPIPWSTPLSPTIYPVPAPNKSSFANALYYLFSSDGVPSIISGMFSQLVQDWYFGSALVDYQFANNNDSGGFHRFLTRVYANRGVIIDLALHLYGLNIGMQAVSVLSRVDNQLKNYRVITDLPDEFRDLSIHEILVWPMILGGMDIRDEAFITFTHDLLFSGIDPIQVDSSIPVHFFGSKIGPLLYLSMLHVASESAS